jgi:hypothetical protein
VCERVEVTHRHGREPTVVGAHVADESSCILPINRLTHAALYLVVTQFPVESAMPHRAQFQSGASIAVGQVGR